MKTDHIKNRNMIMQVVLMIVTLGIYSIYWYYATLKELHIANGKEDAGEILWTILMFIPLANFFAYWHYSKECAAFTDDKYPNFLMFILWVFFSPAVWLLTQLELNKASTAPA